MVSGRVVIKEREILRESIHLITISRLAIWTVVGTVSLVAHSYASDSGSENLVGRTLDRNVIQGEIRPRDHAILAAEIAARITSIPLREGERFRKGQIIVTFDCSLFNAKLDQARAVESSARKKYATEKRLHELNSIGNLEVELSKDALARASAELKIAKVTSDYCTIEAPYEGRVVALKARQHQFAKVGDPVLEILNEESMEIEFIIPSRRLAEFKKGTKIMFLVNEDGKKYPASVLRRGAQIDPVSQSIGIIGRIDERFSELVPGMSGVVMSVSQ